MDKLRLECPKCGEKFSMKLGSFVDELIIDVHDPSREFLECTECGGRIPLHQFPIKGEISIEGNRVIEGKVMLHDDIEYFVGDCVMIDLGGSNFDIEESR